MHTWGIDEIQNFLLSGHDINSIFRDPNGQKHTFLTMSVNNNNLNVVRWLLEHNANPNLVVMNNDNNTMDKFPIEIAVERHYADMCKLLFKHKSKTIFNDVPTDIHNVLVNLIISDPIVDIDMLHILLRLGRANPNIIYRDNLSVFSCYMQDPRINQNIDYVILLLNYRSRPTVRDVQILRNKGIMYNNL